jgi:hypothetical protein
MSTINIPNSKANLIDNDTHYEVVPRRRSDRRDGKPSEKLASESDGIKVQKMDTEQADSLREGERRQFDRRTSRPTLLSVDEIATLRKK